MEYCKVGDWVTFLHLGVCGKGVIVKISARRDDLVLVRMVGICSGMGHTNEGQYETKDYFWFNASRLTKSDNRMYSGHAYRYTTYAIPDTVTLTYGAEPDIDWIEETCIVDVRSASCTLGYADSGRYR